jgi:RNA-directed DNA polymerase
MSAGTQRPTYEWNRLPWKQIQRRTFKLQKRIYQASQRGDVRAVHRLQRLLMTSWSTKCLAVRRVTQDNTGKRTAGIDGVKALLPGQRLQLVATLRVPTKPRPTRRVWIPKPGSTEQRPLGIPTIRDRAAQALVKLALEPEWEARFEPNSYGFRPGRSTHDAIQAIFYAVRQKPKYVLDADLVKCFDRIAHEALLAKLAAPPSLRRAVKAMLQAGVMDGPTLFPTEAGTPQGGVVSPLLANIALHGLESHITTQPGLPKDAHGNLKRAILIRYADDLVLFHEDREVLRGLQRATEAWLQEMGLELHPTKTCTTHTLHEYEGRVGFDFLGFNVRMFPTGRTHTRKNSQGRRILGERLVIRPSDDAMKRHQKALSATIDRLQAAPQAALIKALTPQVTGWTRYYRTMASARWFQKADYRLHQRLRRWCRRRHPNKGARWQLRKYWHRGWVFGPRGSPLRLPLHQDTHIERHVKVAGGQSPYNGDWVYWSTRLGRHPELPKRVAKLLQRQRGHCAHCRLYFNDGDLPEVDHVIPRALGGRDAYSNWQLLHRHCHDEKTARNRGTP